MVRSRAGQAEAEAAASSQQLALTAAAAARSSFFVGKKIACGAVQVPVKKSPAAQGGAWVGLLKNEKRLHLCTRPDSWLYDFCVS